MTALGSVTPDQADDWVAAGPVVVIGRAGWSTACRAFDRLILAACAAVPSGVRVAGLDVDAHPELARRWAICRVPEVLLFIGGTLQARCYGPLTAREFTRFIQPAVAAAAGTQEDRDVRAE